MKYFITFFILSFVHFFYSQVEITPFITSNYRLTNLKDVYSEDTSFYVKYSNKVLPEIGVSLTKERANKFDYGLGISWKRYDYGYYLEYKKDFLGNKDFRDRSITLDAFGIRVFSKHQIFNNTKLSLIVETNIPYKVITSVENRENFSYFRLSKISINTGETVQTFEITVRERQNNDFSKFYNYIVPEINFQTNIIKNINLYYGAKLKVWSIYDLYTINTWGYYDMKDKSKPLFSSKIDSKKIFFYCGLSYTLKKVKSS